MPFETIRVLIWGKTYPELSKKYVETVCTGGVREDGSPIRLYPVPLRYLEGSKAVVAYREFPGRSHLSIVRSGWQDMADQVLHWAEQPTATAEEVLTTHRDGGTSP